MMVAVGMEGFWSPLWRDGTNWVGNARRDNRFLSTGKR